MKGLILEAPLKLTVAEVDDPVMAHDRVILEVKACGVCGGDLKAYMGRGKRNVFPRRMSGHEYAGIVVEVGRDVRGFKIGDRVANVTLPACGRCFACRTGHTNYCQTAPESTSASLGAGFGERVAFTVDPTMMGGHFIVPDDIDIVHAALAEPATCAIGAVKRGPIRPSDIVAVIGLGGLGQLVAQVATGVGARTIGIDVQKEKVELASRWCEWVIDASSQDPVEAVLEITGRRGADVVMEVVGRPEPFEQAFHMVRLGGRVVIVGGHTAPVPSFHPEWIFRKDVELVGAKGAFPLLATSDEPVVFDYMRRGIIQVEPLIATFSLDSAQEGFEAQRTGGIPKAVICP